MHLYHLVGISLGRNIGTIAVYSGDLPLADLQDATFFRMMKRGMQNHLVENRHFSTFSKFISVASIDQVRLSESRMVASRLRNSSVLGLVIDPNETVSGLFGMTFDQGILTRINLGLLKDLLASEGHSIAFTLTVNYINYENGITFSITSITTVGRQADKVKLATRL